MLLVTAGIQPDPSYRIGITGVQVLIEGEQLVAFARITKQGEATAAFSLPWALVAVDARVTGAVGRCFLNIEGEAAIKSDCH